MDLTSRVANWDTEVILFIRKGYLSTALCLIRIQNTFLSRKVYNFISMQKYVPIYKQRR